jgi:hypothetical protein
MRNTIRVIGGPAHGRVESVPQGCGDRKHLSIAVPQSGAYWAGYTGDFSHSLSSMVSTFEYESRKIMLGPLTAVEVLCPPNMTDNELMRRLADIIDGHRLER